MAKVGYTGDWGEQGCSTRSLFYTIGRGRLGLRFSARVPRSGCFHVDTVLYFNGSSDLFALTQSLDAQPLFGFDRLILRESEYSGQQGCHLRTGND